METRQELRRQSDELLVQYQEKLKALEEDPKNAQKFEEFQEACFKFTEKGIQVLHAEQQLIRAQDELILSLAKDLLGGTSC